MIVQDCMTRAPFVAQATDSVAKVWRKLLEADVRHLPVIDDGMLVGIVSDRDLQGALGDASRASSPRSAEEMLERPISTLMSSDVLSVNPETDLGEVIDLMIDHKIGLRSEEHTSELQSQSNLVCRLLLEKKNKLL